MGEPVLPPARYEQADVTFRFLLCGAGVFLATVLFCAIAVMWLYPTSVQDRRLTSALPIYPAPRLQTDPAAELQSFTTRELSRLNSLGWQDESHGIVHIPIEDAMRRVAAQGIADWPGPSGSRR